MSNNSQSIHIKKDILVRIVEAFFSDDFCLFLKKCISFRNNSHISCNVTDCSSARYPVKKTTYRLLNAAFPGYCAPVPNSSSIRRSWLYFATRSLRLGAPVLIWQVFNATARSAIVVSSVSPERWDTIAV